MSYWGGFGASPHDVLRLEAKAFGRTTRQRTAVAGISLLSNDFAVLLRANIADRAPSARPQRAFPNSRNCLSGYASASQRHERPGGQERNWGLSGHGKEVVVSRDEEFAFRCEGLSKNLFVVRVPDTEDSFETGHPLPVHSDLVTEDTARLLRDDLRNNETVFGKHESEEIRAESTGREGGHQDVGVEAKPTHERILKTSSSVRIPCFSAKGMILRRASSRSSTLSCRRRASRTTSRGGDLILVTDVAPDVENVELSDMVKLTDGIRPSVLSAALQVAVKVGRAARRGTRRGALFVLGDSDRVLEGVRQLILNPFRGHQDADRRLTNTGIHEMLVELSELDGAVVVRGDGLIRTGGAYLTAPDMGVEVAPGLGARHTAAAAITASTDATAVVVSATDGGVRVFSGGQLVLHMDPDVLLELLPEDPSE